MKTKNKKIKKTQNKCVSKVSSSHGRLQEWSRMCKNSHLKERIWTPLNGCPLHFYIIPQISPKFPRLRVFCYASQGLKNGLN